MSNKLKLKDINWSKAPVDAEEGATYESNNTIWYKDIVPNSGYKYNKGYGWEDNYGTPYYLNRIKRPSNTFTKSMLVAGKYVVEIVGGEIYVVFNGEDGEFLLNPTNKYGWISLSEYNEDLRRYYFDNTYDIVKVYTTKGSNFRDNERLTLIWERTPVKVPAQKELQLAALQDTINKAQEQIESLMKS